MSVPSSRVQAVISIMTNYISIAPRCFVASALRPIKMICLSNLNFAHNLYGCQK